MGLLNYYDERNKIETSLLTTQYLTERVGYVGAGAFGQPIMKYTRIRTKSYSYVGMDKETARRCANEKLQKYTRRFWNWEYINGMWRQNRTYDGMYFETCANASATKQDGNMYSTQIQVNEVAIVYLMGVSNDLEKTFNAYGYGKDNGWTYDEDGEV